jgi:hypothetical protein
VPRHQKYCGDGKTARQDVFYGSSSKEFSGIPWHWDSASWADYAPGHGLLMNWLHDGLETCASGQVRVLVAKRGVF